MPAEPGDYDERRVYKLDLYERSPDEAAEKFRQYLGRESVASGESLRAARTEYHNLNRRSQAKAAIPEAWRELVQKRDSSLIEILAGAVESKVGFRPDAGDVVKFFGSTATPKLALESVPVPPRPSPTPLPAQGQDADPTREQLGERRSAAAKKAAASRRRTASQPLVIRGKKYRCPTAKDAMVTVLRTLADSDPSFLERFAKQATVPGRKRRYIGRTLDELYPNNGKFRAQHEKLPGGWLVATHMDNDRKRRIIDLAAETAGWPREEIELPF